MREAKKETYVRDEVQLAVFRVGGEEYAIDIMRIMEIIRPQKVVRVPKAPAFIEGIINLRGNIVPILDMRGRFGQEAVPSRKARIVILRVDGRMLGVVVDEVTEVLYIKSEQMDETPEVVKGPEAQYLKGVAKVGERLIFLLDVPKLLTGEEMHALKAVEEQGLGVRD